MWFCCLVVSLCFLIHCHLACLLPPLSALRSPPLATCDKQVVKAQQAALRLRIGEMLYQLAFMLFGNSHIAGKVVGPLMEYDIKVLDRMTYQRGSVDIFCHFVQALSLYYANKAFPFLNEDVAHSYFCNAFGNVTSAMRLAVLTPVSG